MNFKFKNVAETDPKNIRMIKNFILVKLSKNSLLLSESIINLMYDLTLAIINRHSIKKTYNY